MKKDQDQVPGQMDVYDCIAEAESAQVLTEAEFQALEHVAEVGDRHSWTSCPPNYRRAYESAVAKLDLTTPTKGAGTPLTDDARASRSTPQTPDPSQVSTVSQIVNRRLQGEMA